MIFAIVCIGGKQYKVSPGKKIKIGIKQDSEIGAKLIFDQVLAVRDQHLHIGNPYLESAFVSASVLKLGKHKKILVFKKKRRHGYQKLQGHRQQYTEIIINEVYYGS